nr:hypothetical protein [Tanacetum cinerariifolium]
MRYEHLSITPETESDEVTESNGKNLLPIPSECEVTSEDKRECDELVCDNYFDTFSDSKIDDDILVYDDFEDIEYIEASLLDPEIVSIEEENGVEEENVVQREEEEVDLEDISQVQYVVLREKLFIITRLISNIEYLNENSTLDCVFNSFESDNSLLDNYSPEFKTFCDNSKETRSEEADSFLDDNPIPPGIENFADDPEGDICFLEELLIDDSILSHELFDSNFEDNPSIPRPPPKPPDAETDVGEEIAVVMNDKDKFDDDYQIFMVDKVFSLLSAESEDTIFDHVIKFGDSYKVPTNTDPNDTTRRRDDEQSGRTVTITTEDMQRKKNDVKARTTLLLSLPNEHQLRFSKYKTVKELWAAILKMFGVEMKIVTLPVFPLLALPFPLDINQIDEDDIEEMDIKWSMALLSMMANKFWKRTGKKISIQGSDVAGFDKSKVE